MPIKKKRLSNHLQKTFNKIKRIDENEIASDNVDILRKNYNDYVIEQLSTYFGKEMGEYFADILYYYNDNEKIINPKQDKNIDEIGKSYYGFSSFVNIRSINKDEAMSYDLYIFTDDKNTIINSVNYLVNYLKSFKIDSIEQIDFMVDNDSTGDLEQEKFIYDNLIPSEDLKKYFVKKSYNKNFTTDNNNSFNPYFMDKINENEISEASTVQDKLDELVGKPISLIRTKHTRKYNPQIGDSEAVTEDQQINGVIGKIGDFEGIKGLTVMNGQGGKIAFLMYDKKSGEFVEGDSTWKYTYKGADEQSDRILKFILRYLVGVNSINEFEELNPLYSRQQQYKNAYQEQPNVSFEPMNENEINEMERFDATAYQEKNNFNPTQRGDKYNVQYEIFYCDGSTCGNHMWKTVDVYANSEEEAIKLGDKELKHWEQFAFNGAANEFDELGEPMFKIERYEVYAIENESAIDRGDIERPSN